MIGLSRSATSLVGARCASIRRSVSSTPADNQVTARHISGRSALGAPADCARLGGIGLRSAGRIGEDYRTVLQPLLVGELEVEAGGVHVLEQPLPCAGYDGHDPEAELVDQV